MTPADLEIRPARASDRPAILALLRDSLGWSDDERYEALFDWKHVGNPFGQSAGWVAYDNDRLAGLRVLMRWELDHAGTVARVVRAVDTATHPDYRGRGLFTTLTMHALTELEREGVAFVFNTPNDQSRPGYLKMGWRVAGRVPVVVRPSSPAALVRMARARTPAERWSERSAAGVPADEALADRAGIEALLASRPPSRAVTTRVTPDFLAWRYGSRPIEYRAIALPGGVASGVAFFRVRRRGPTVETALCEVLAPGDDARVQRELVRRVARESRTDYVIAASAALVSATGFVRLPRQGPILTTRTVASDAVPPLREWNLRLGDVELL